MRDLFFNTPARRKFQRSEKTETGHVDTVLKNLALARFDVEFSLASNERPMLRLGAARDRAEQEARIAALCGAEFLEHARHFRRDIEGLRIEGWLAAPAFSRSQPDMQFTFVNGRFVRDKVLRHAVRLGYQDVLFQARQPAFVVFLELDPRRVDANAHPAKLEIRFRDSSLVHEFVFRTVEAALASTLESGGSRRATARAGRGVRRACALFTARRRAAPRAARAARSRRCASTFRCTSGCIPRARRRRHVADAAATPPLGYALAQLSGIYVLAENRDGLIIVDMHAAHERITYERMKAALGTDKLKSQTLLVPVTLEVGSREADLVEERGGELEALGFHARAARPRAHRRAGRFRCCSRAATSRRWCAIC